MLAPLSLARGEEEDVPLTHDPLKLYVRQIGDGRGDIALRLGDETRIAYFVLWPHARPWRLKSPQPMLRALPKASDVGRILAEAIAADVSPVMSSPVRLPQTRSMPEAIVNCPALVAAE